MPAACPRLHTRGCKGWGTLAWLQRTTSCMLMKHLVCCSIPQAAGMVPVVPHDAGWASAWQLPVAGPARGFRPRTQSQDPHVRSGPPSLQLPLSLGRVSVAAGCAAEQPTACKVLQIWTQKWSGIEQLCQSCLAALTRALMSDTPSTEVLPALNLQD